MAKLIEKCKEKPSGFVLFGKLYLGVTERCGSDFVCCIDDNLHFTQDGIKSFKGLYIQICKVSFEVMWIE